MIMSTVGVDYPRLGNSLLALGKPLVPWRSVSLGLGEGATWLDAAAPPLTTTGCQSARDCSCRRRGAYKNQVKIPHVANCIIAMSHLPCRTFQILKCQASSQRFS
jgi:hypothetical protein